MMPPIPLLVVAIVLVAMAIAFVVWFALPSSRLDSVLQTALSALTKLEARDPAALRQIFSADSKLSHLWAEFEETLHTQRTAVGGVDQVSAVRSTIPAESYFNSQTVVDSRVHAEFFKHLPGLLTGAGIIGTFSGLIEGLKGFDSTAPQAGLNRLLHEVGTAFLISASAITLAMLATGYEKYRLNRLYRLIEEIAQEIDKRFDAGAGEEYLARLVSASEDSATQAKILKDSLVNDLRDVLKEIAERQISAGSQANADLGDRIARTIADGLTAPLDKISDSVKTASGDQSANASRLLQDAMAGFTQQVSELFGGQLRGIAALNTGAADGMTQVVETLNRLVGNLESTSARATESMNEQIAGALTRMEQHQQASNTQSAAFIEQLRSLVAESQSETATRMQAALATLGESVSAMIESMRTSNERAFATSNAREEAVAERVSSSVSTMSGSMDAAAVQIAEASKTMLATVGDLTRFTTSAIDRMNQGANTLNSATTGFAEAGRTVTGVVGQVATVGSKFSELSGAMTSSASSLQVVIADYRAQREAIVTLLRELNTAVELARREMSVSTDFVEKIERASERLAVAQGQVSEYMDGVGAVLVEAQGKFSDATVKTLDRVNQDFHTQLKTATNLLSATIQELDSTLSSIGARK